MSSEADRPPRAAAETGSANAPPFVGRAAELGGLGAALGQVVAGAGRLVFVVGEPGIGKSALVGEFLRRAREHADPPLTLCRGRCTEQYGAGEAYLPFLDGIGSLLRGRGGERTRQILRTYAPTWCLQLPVAAGGDAESLQRQTVGANKERMLREIADAFDAASREFPVLILGEDFQWADPASVDLLRHLAGRLARQRLFLVITLRDADLETANPPMYRGLLDLRQHAQEIRLGPLEAASVSDYLDTVFHPHRFPPELAALLERRTEGHPLFLVSLVQFLRDRGDIAFDGQVFVLSRPLAEGDVPAPENVRGMIRRALDALPEGERIALQHASVLGRDFLSAVLARLLETDEVALEERLSRLLRGHHLLSTGGEEELPDGTLAVRYRFVHSLYPETLYADLVPARRQLLHKKAGLALVEGLGAGAFRQAALLALHFDRGRDFPSAIAWRLQAADNAAALHAYAEALGHCDQAEALLERVEEGERARLRLLLHEKRGALSHALGRFDLAIREFTLMRERARAGGDAGRECDALLGLGQALFYARRPEELAVRAHEAALAAAESGSPAHRTAARLLVALLLQDAGELASAESLLLPLVEEARALRVKGVLMGALLQRGTLHYWRSAYPEAQASLQEALRLATEAGDAFTALVALMFTGNAQVNRGRVGEGRQSLLEGIALARRNGDSFWLARLLSQLGWLHRELQDFEHAREHGRQALAVAREAGVRWAPEPDALLSLFLDDAHSGSTSAEATEARLLLERTEAERTLLGWLFEIRKESALAEHYLGRGEAGPSREHALRLLQAASEHGTPNYGVAAHRLLADAALCAGRPQDAVEPLETALDLLRVHDCPLIAWRTYASLGRLNARLGAPAEARDAFGRAATIVRALAASVDDVALQQCFLLSSAVREVMAGETGRS